MSLLETFNLNATKTLIAVSIIVALLWSMPYFLPADPTTISANPAGWGILAVFIWGLYCAFTATEYRALRGLGMQPQQWLMSMHATLWLAAFVFGAIAWLTFYAALRAGVDMYSSWVISPGSSGLRPLFARVATLGSFICGHLLTGYIGALIGSVVSSANQSSLLARILFIIGIIVSLALANGLLITLIEAFGEMRIGAPWPGLFFFTGLSIIICSAGIHFIARRIQP
ncbi:MULTISPECIES: transglycosylase [Corynebacterium]|uniref:transglycosylase n=1 Tax=Corynebacterium TaxID=1716 RepID=UPI001EF2BD9C|nr:MULTISPECIES: transglycosylase [Corynebacterium]MCG7460603.1 transglycosylase [Corynebacterium sp. ACRPF]MCG7466873.1 transglycosylase [Corynebacterium sp. ACRPE]MDV2418005.1 transglycosylase [Corynebacterium tuberculostearicum]